PLERATLAGRLALASEQASPTTSLTVEIGFQFASTALTTTLKLVPAVCEAGVPDFPLAVPGIAVSPGTSNCNLVKAPAFTEIAGLLLLRTDGLDKSVALRVALPAVLRVTLKILVPLVRLVLAGSTALRSEEARPTMLVTVLTTLPRESTAFTVTLRAEPAVSAGGTPVLAGGGPGAAVLPGTRSCSPA